VAEQLADLLGRGVGGHVEVLGTSADQQVAYRAPDQVGAIATLAQPVEHAQRFVSDVLAGDVVLLARDDLQHGSGQGEIWWHQAGIAAGWKIVKEPLPNATQPHILASRAGLMAAARKTCSLRLVV